MKYGVVKNGKLLLKYAFKEDQSEALAKVKNSTAVPLEESSGKGAVTYVLQADKITMTFEKHEEFFVKFGSLDAVEVSDTARKFLEKFFSDAMKQTKNGKIFRYQWKLGNPELKTMRRLVWDRWDRYLSEFIASKFTYDDGNDEDGVSFADLTMYSFFGEGWPIQNKNGKRPLSNAEITRIKNEVKASLIAKRNAVEAACTTDTQTVAAWLAALEGSAKWILNGEV